MTSARQRAQHIRLLNAIAETLTHSAALQENSGNPGSQGLANRLKDQAAAVRWAVGELTGPDAPDPEVSVPRGFGQ